jgi:GDPmannose 4,6-dehydratase
MCYVSQGLDDCIFLGNLDALRDWGHARDYVRAQWLMLQQDEPRDFVIATGQQYSVRQFVIWAAEELGITLRFEGSGVDEVGIVDTVSGAVETRLKPGDVIVRIDPRYFRPAEVESLVGDATAAREMLGWRPETTAQEMCAEMMATDLDAARRHALLISHGYNLNAVKED